MASKIRYEEVKKNLKEMGWNLISTSYTNLKTDLEVECSEGHTNYVSYEKLRKNYQCLICKNNQYKNVNEIAVKKKGFRVLAVDQATITSGWAILDNEELISYGSHTSEGVHSTEKIGQTKYWFVSMINKWKPDIIVLEDIQLQTYKKDEQQQTEMVTTFKKLAHLQGVLKNYCYENNLRYKVVTPSTWRHYSEIKGTKRTDQKRNAQLKVKKLYDVSVSQDESDAILIGRWAAHENKANEIIEF